MSQAISGAFAEHQRLIWGLCYRMLGTVADADEVLQETFIRALEKRPSEDRPLRPWLVRVAANLSRDRLRKRRRAPYIGQWLPSPIDTGPQEPLPWLRQIPAADDRLALSQSASYAWLLAVEALTPNQRAVLVLREVMELSTTETASALDMSASNVKVTLHRAHRALRPLKDRPDPEEGTSAEAARLLAQLGLALESGDLDAVLALLTDDAVAISDGGGAYHAAMNAVRGARQVAKLYLGLVKKSPGAHFDLRLINGMPAVITWWDAPKPGFAPRAVLAIDVRAGKIDRIWSVLAPGKLGA